MDPHAGKLVLNGAPSQYGRLLPSPDAARARVDGRTPDEVRAFAVRMAGLVNFYGLDDQVDGDWSEFFLSDPAALESSLAAAGGDAAQDAVAALGRRALEEEDPERRGALLHALFDAAHGLGRQADAWLRAARGVEGGTARRMERRVAAAIAEELAPALRRLHGWHGAAVRAGLLAPGGLDAAGFSAEWKLDAPRADEGRGGAGEEAEGMEVAVPHLVRTFGDAAEALRALRDAAAGLADAAPEGTRRPQAALFEAFVSLFGIAQATLDTLTPRYGDFYYRKVLREPLRGPVPDRVYLAFALGEDTLAPAPVPRGTPFDAGQDADGRALVYAAERPLSVTPAALSRVRMLRAVRGPLVIAPFPPPVLPLPAPPLPVLPDPVVEVLASRLLGEEEAEALGEEILAAEGWPTFGPDAAGVTGRLVTEPATLGFAVASPELLLTGGWRQVDVVFGLVPGEPLAGYLRAQYAATGTNPWGVLSQVLEKALALDVSTSDGWFPLETYCAEVAPPTLPGGDAAFTLGFELPPSVPALVPLYAGVDDPPEPAAGTPEAVNPAPGLPTLRAFLRPERVMVAGAAVSPLALLDALRVRAVEVWATVQGLTDLAVSNTDGPVDPSAPFYVFGGAPQVGSYLELRSPELFAKVPEDLTVTVRWLGLPPNEDGFRGWYRDYTVGLDGKPRTGAPGAPPPPPLFDNDTFRSRWRVLEPGGWTLRGQEGSSTPGEPDYLFRTRDAAKPEPAGCDVPVPTPGAPLCAETGFVKMEVDRSKDPPPPYYTPADNALRLELVQPPYAFGADLYAVNVLNAVLEDIPNAEDCAVLCQAACQPLQDAAVALEACAAVCPPVDPAVPGPCTDCVEAVLDELGGAAMDGLLGWLPEGSTKEQVRRIGALQREHRPAALAKVIRSTPGASRQPFARMHETTLALQVMLMKGGPTAAELAAAVAALQAAYDAALALCIRTCAQPRELRSPNPPYLPQAERVTVGYRSAGVVDRGAIFHLAPFGGWTPLPASAAGFPLLPVPAPGASLLLGFGGLLQAQPLTLLFQMEARGGAPVTAPVPVPAWSALDGDDWQTLSPGAVVEDGTHGLLNSGIVALEVPAGAPAGTVLPGAERWLRASVGPDAGGFPWTVSIHPHALSAVWVDDGTGGGAQLAVPLPAGTITTPVDDLPGIGTVLQPMPSFGGRPPEKADSYGARLSERLRHKDRAVQPWDYERLVLDAFPQLWMVRAVPARDLTGATPGATLVVVVAGEEGNESADLTVPRAPSALLGRVRDFLVERASPFARIEVVNPRYVAVKVTAEVGFLTGPAGGDADRLNADLVAWLSPWFYDAERAARQGRYAFEADISEFIQTRPYVETLYSLSLEHDPAVKELEWYFLTSADAHAILERRFDGGAR